MNIGGHVSAKGGIDNAVDNACAIGANVFQTHPTAPQTWRSPHVEDDVLTRYKEKYDAANIQGHFLHAMYLINLATPKEDHRAKSVDALVNYMKYAHVLGATGVVFHPGSHLGAGFDVALSWMGDAIKEILANTPESPFLIIENSAGAGGCVGRTFEEIARILEKAGSDRVKVCLDTAHMFASGYDVRSEEQVEDSFHALDTTIGLDRVVVIHANDSRSDFGSNVDRHANIGEGLMGRDAFVWMLRNKLLRQIPWILEVPGIEHTGPDRVNVERLYECAGVPLSEMPC